MKLIYPKLSLLLIGPSSSREFTFALRRSSRQNWSTLTYPWACQ